jgi:hypothetical protein
LPPDKESAWQEIEAKFKSDNYDLLGLMQQIALSPLLHSPPVTTTEALAERR